MFLVDKALVSAVKSGQMTKRELVQDLLRQNTIMEMAERLADYIINEDESSPIVVSQEEFDRITSLFRIRGMRVDGTFENRGKKIK